MSGVSTVPLLGVFGTGSKYINKAANYADDAAEAVSKAGKEALEQADDVLQYTDEAGEAITKLAKKTAKGVTQEEFNKLVKEALREATAGKAFTGGKAGEEILEKVFGGIPQKQYKTALTYRYVDLFSDEVIRESKVGYKAMTEALRKQALKDSLVVVEKGLKAEWHFFRSDITGMIGADKRLLDLLDDLGIKYFIHR